MKDFFHSLVALVPFLDPYPLWVKLFCGLSIICFAVFFIGFLFFKPTISEVTKKPKEVDPPSATQRHEGRGDNVAGDKNVTNYFFPDANRQPLPPEIRRVPLKYASESGLQAELEAQGYQIRWSKDEMKAGWEPVIKTLDDGIRIMFKDSISGLTLLRKKAESPNQVTVQTPQSVPQKEFTTKTPHDLLGLYKVLNPIAGNDALNVFKGKWIKAEGTIVNMVPGAPDGNQAGVVLRNDNDTIECRFGPQWKNSLLRLSLGDLLRVHGKIASTQNHSQLYLEDCEIQQ